MYNLCVSEKNELDFNTYTQTIRQTQEMMPHYNEEDMRKFGTQITVELTGKLDILTKRFNDMLYLVENIDSDEKLESMKKICKRYRLDDEWYLDDTGKKTV